MRLWHALLNGVHRNSRAVLFTTLLLLALLITVKASGTSYAQLLKKPVQGMAENATQIPFADCVSSSAPRGYSVNLCITSPWSGATLTGNTTVRASVGLSGPAANVQRVVFSVDGAYVLTDYSSPYSFVLPIDRWADGPHTLSVSVMMNDGYVSASASRPVTFKNSPSGTPAGSEPFKPTSGRPAENGAPFVVAAAGDGASGQPSSTKVVNMLRAADPNLFLYLGDVYERGSDAEFLNWYASPWQFGGLRSITDPTVGNHEYLTPDARGYFDYWRNVPSYYSFDANGWHFVSLNSNYQFEGTQAVSSQSNWLQNDLASLPQNTCTIVFYHHPYFNIGPEGPSTQMASIWQLMAQHGVDIVLNGHDHDYQRWKPLDGNGNLSSTGITEFVVGSGGHGLQDFTSSDGRVAYSNDANPAAFGAVFLTLHPDGADFQYRSTSGEVLDSGSVPCVAGG